MANSSIMGSEIGGIGQFIDDVIFSSMEKCGRGIDELSVILSKERLCETGMRNVWRTNQE